MVANLNNLEWDGWDVVKYTPSHSAQFSVDGCFKNGKWFYKKVFTVTENGWLVPDSIGREYEQLER